VQTIERLEMMERDIVAIESRFSRMSRRAGPEDPIDAVADAADEAAAIEPVPAPPAEGPPAAAGSPAPEAAGESPPARVNINEATFETLRSLGCSVTQTARILSTRAARGGFGSVDELADVPGLPAALREDLIGRLAV